MMHRSNQLLLISTLLPLCWFLMMAVHEGGHLLCAFATGGKVTALVLHPFAISRTDVAPNPAPLIVCWGGPVAGCLIPLTIWFLCRAVRWKLTCLARFFCGFCFIANGAYISAGSFDSVGDSGDLLRLGCSPILLWGFGLLTIPAGFLVWHGTGSEFGLGSDRRPIDPAAPRFTALLLITVIVLELLFSHT